MWSNQCSEVYVGRRPDLRRLAPSCVADRGSIPADVDSRMAGRSIRPGLTGARAALPERERRVDPVAFRRGTISARRHRQPTNQGDRESESATQVSGEEIPSLFLGTSGYFSNFRLMP